MEGNSLKRACYKVKFAAVDMFSPIAKVSKAYRHGSISTRAALTLGVIPGLGALVQGRILSGLGTLALVALYIVYMVFAGVPAFNGTGVFTGGLQDIGILIAVIFTLVMPYVIVRAYSSCARRACDDADGKPVAPSSAKLALKSVWKKICVYFSNYKRAVKGASGRRKAAMILAFIPGLGHVLQKQIGKGIIFLLLTAAFVVYMLLSGGSSIVGFITLKTEGMLSSYNLVYGWLAIFITVFFLTFYIMQLGNAARNELSLQSGEKLSTFKADLKALTDASFYKTLLFVPIVGALLFTVLPIAFMVSVAFTDWATAMTIPQVNRVWLSWTGVLSFKTLFSNANYFSSFLNIIVWTVLWAVLATFTCYFGGILLALLINKKVVKCKVLWRSIFVLTLAIPQLVTLRVMFAMFNEFGPVNGLLLNFGWITERINFWGDTVTARTLIIFINMWVGIPYFMLLISGLLMNIPEDLYEYAHVEGASAFKIFTKITMPYILFMTAPMLISNFISNFNNFNVIWLLTGGGPLGNSTGGVAGGTDILITWLFKLTMQNNPDYNIGSAVGIIMFIISATLSLAVYHRSASYKNEGDFQ